MGNIIMSATTALVSVAVFLNSFGFPVIGGTVSAGFWPRIISVLLFITSGMVTIEAVKEYRLKSAKESKEQRRERIRSSPDYFPWGTPRMIGTCVLFGLYVLYGLQSLGFVLSTFIFVAAFTIWFGNKKYWQAVVNGVLTTAVCTFLFCTLMLIPLPRGTGVFRAFSLLFY